MVRHGLDGHGLLDQPEKQFAPMMRTATVEPEREFVQVIVQMCLADGPLVRAEPPALEQRDHAMDARQLIHRQGGVAAQEGDPMSIPR